MVADQIIQVIDMIAQKLGVAVEAVYPMLLKQADVFGAAYHATLWVLGGSMILFIASIIWACVAFSKGSDTLPVAAAWALIFGMIALITGLIAGIDLKEYLTSVYNPDMWVIEYITRLLM